MWQVRATELRLLFRYDDDFVPVDIALRAGIVQQLARTVRRARSVAEIAARIRFATGAGGRSMMMSWPLCWRIWTYWRRSGDGEQSKDFQAISSVSKGSIFS
jgi:hypothetical protein